MKICVISSTVFPCPPLGYAGLEMIAWECARGLAKKGHDVTLIAPAGSSCPGVDVFQCLPPGHGEEQAYGGCVLKDANNNDVRWPGYWSKLLEFNDGGVLIDHSWQKWCYELKREGRLTAPILGVCHAPIQTMYGVLPPVEHPCFVCISQDQKAHFDALHSPRTARFVYNGCDVGFYKPINVPRSNRFLFLARFSTIKGPDLAIEACKKAGVGLDLIGDTSITNEPALYEHCKRLADGEQIKIIGSVPRGETVWWYSQAHALLHPNQRFREPFGLAPVEAMLCGCPVIAWRYGAMPETIVPGETGLLCESMDDLVTHIKTLSKVLKPEDRPRCRDWAMQFSIDKMVDGYEALCYEALKHPW